MDDLSLLFPVPQPVTIGPWSGTAVCLQLRDLARLQAIAAGLCGGDPLAGRRAPLIEARIAAGGDYLGDTEASHAYGDRLREAVGAAREWPPALHGRRAEAALDSPAGLVLWLDVLLSRTNEGFTPTTAAGLLRHMTAEDWLLLRQVAYADHPADWLLRLMEPAPARRGKKDSWGKMVAEVARETGWTYRQIGEMYLSQFYAFRSGGAWQPGVMHRTKENKAWYRAALGRLQRLMAGRNGRAH